MEKILLADGTEREVPTAEEYKALQEKATQADTLQSDILKKEEEIKTLQEGISPNWKEIRAKLAEGEQLKTQLASLNGGTPPAPGPAPKTMSEEDVQKIATKTTQNTLVEKSVENRLSRLDSQKQEQVKEFYKSLTQGKDLNEQTAQNFLDAAFRAAGLEPFRQPQSFSTNFAGGEPTAPTATSENRAKALDNLKSMGYKFKSKDPSNLGK